MKKKHKTFFFISIVILFRWFLVKFNIIFLLLDIESRRIKLNIVIRTNFVAFSFCVFLLYYLFRWIYIFSILWIVFHFGCYCYYYSHKYKVNGQMSIQQLFIIENWLKYVFLHLKLYKTLSIPIKPWNSS